MIANKISLGLFIFGIFYATIALGDTYRCRNSKGQTEFRNTLCPEGSTTEKARIITPAAQASNKPKQMGVTPMWETPPGYIREGSPEWANRATISPKIYGPGGSEDVAAANLSSSGEFDFDSLMVAVTNAKSIDVKRTKTGQLAGALAAYEAMTYREALAEAEMKTGVKQWEAKFNASRAADMQSPNNPGKILGPYTLQIQQQLEMAKAEARQLASQNVAINQEFARIKAGVNMFLTVIDAETQSQLEQLQHQQEQLELEQDEAKDRAEQARQEAEDQAKKVAEAAEDEAADLRSKILRAEIRRSNNLYLGGFLLLVVWGSFYVIKKNKVGGIMNANQKYGIAIIVLSLLLLILALMISDGWINNLDFLGNLMQSLHIQFIEIKGNCGTLSLSNFNVIRDKDCVYDHHFIYLQTKYVVLAFIGAAAYGLTTYLGITPAFMPWKKSSVK